MKKTIDEILERNDYIRLTKQLRERVEDIAGRIRNKMNELDIDNDNDFCNGEIGCGDIVLRAAEYYYNGGGYETLTIKAHDEYGVCWHTLEDVGRTRGEDDYGNRIDGRATNSECLAFLNVARDLIDGMDEIEDEKSIEVQKALESAKNI